MLTNEDVKKLAKYFATKQDLGTFASKQDLEKFATKDDLEDFSKKGDLDKLKSAVLTRMDEVYTEVKKMREEQSAHFDEHRKINDRLSNIEEVPIIAQALSK